MRTAVIVLMIFGVVMLTEAFVDRPGQRPRPSGNFPTFPGHGPFNPRPKWPEAYGRGRRSAAYVDESVDADAEYPLQGRPARGSESDSWLAVD